jgi:hypothetical protein
MTTQNSTPDSFFYRGFVLQTFNGACSAYRAGELVGYFDTTDEAKEWVDAHPIVAEIERRKAAKAALLVGTFDADAMTTDEIRTHKGNVAALFNLNVIKVQTQYAANLRGLREDLVKARRTGRKVRGFNVEQLEKMVRNFEAIVNA